MTGRLWPKAHGAGYFITQIVVRGVLVGVIGAVLGVAVISLAGIVRHLRSQPQRWRARLRQAVLTEPSQPRRLPSSARHGKSRRNIARDARLGGYVCGVRILSWDFSDTIMNAQRRF